MLGGTAPGLYVASASSNNATAYYAFSASTSQTWVSAANYNAANGSYLGTSAQTSTTNGTVYGEWVQLQFPEQFSPQTFTLKSDIASVALFGSNDGASWFEIDQSPCVLV